MDTTNLVAYLPFASSPTEDFCGGAWTATGNVALSSEIKKFGAASVHLPSGAYLTANNVIDLNAEKWTFSAWCYVVSRSDDEGFFGFGEGQTRRGIIAGADGIYIATSDGGSWQAKTSLLFPSVKNQWTHIEVDKNGSSLKFFEDGALVWQSTVDEFSDTGVFTLGGNNYGYTNDLYFDEVIFYQDTALHSEDFTPPTEDDYVALNLAFRDSATIEFTVDVVRKIQNDNFFGGLTVWLPFDTSATEDIGGGNSWTVYGNPTIAGGALQLDGASYIVNTSIAADIANDIWTIHWRATAAASGERFFFGTFNANYGTSGTGSNKWVSVLWYSGNVSISLYGNDTRAGVSLSQNQEYHYALSYDGTNLRLFIDGALKITKAANIKLGGNFRIGIDPSRSTSEAYFQGSIDNFMIHKGVAWTENFTPPTAEDYAAIPRTIYFDVERKIKNPPLTWRYENAGTADSLITAGVDFSLDDEEHTKTGTAFCQTSREKCFDIPATHEIWIKFDVYFNGSARWRAYNGGANGSTGITAQTSGDLSFFVNDSNVDAISNGCKKNQLQTVLLHMTAGSSDGVVEAWIDEQFIYRYEGDVNHGEDFADIYLQSDNAGTLFSNVIISNAPIDFGEGYQIFSADVERRVKKSFDIVFDVQRRVKNVTNVEFSADVEILDVVPVEVSADIERRVTAPVEFAADVEILDVVFAEYTADISRNLLTVVNLFETDNSEYFSGGASVPVVIPPQEFIPIADNTYGVQSMEISLRQQQLTDGVKVVGVVPFDILYPVRGIYFDYVFSMCVEKVQRQGILYSADCCTDIDELLYTPLNYELPNILRVTQTSSEVEEPKYITVTFPTEASRHVEKIAAALGLTPIMQFEDFYSSIDVPDEKIGGATYADLIRDIFGWSARVPTQVIHCYIRADKLFVIQRGHESNVIDITNAEHTLPVVTHELIRLFWQRHKFSTSATREFKRRKIKPTKQSAEISKDNTSESDYDYDNDGLLKKTVTTTKNKDGETIRTETEYKYRTLDSGKKVLVKETTKKFVNGKLDETTETEHTPLKQGMSHKVKLDEDGDIIGESVGQNTSDDRVTPYSQSQLADDENYDTVTTNTVIEGLTLIDTSFPIKIGVDVDDSHWDAETPYEVVEARQSVDHAKGLGRLQQITADIKRLNRMTLETVTLSLYNFQHVIDFNDRIILDGHEFFLVGNVARTTDKIFNEQNLTLARWF